MSRAAPLDMLRLWPLRVWIAAVMMGLYLPLAALVAASFNASRRNISWGGFTFDWYVRLTANDALLEALANSLAIAAMATAASVVLGAAIAIAFHRHRFRFAGMLRGALGLPIVIPDICLGIAMLVFFTRILPWPSDLAWPLSLGAIAIAHVTFCFPFVAVIAGARMASLGRELEEAARDLGAGEWRVLADVVLPHLKPALIAGALLAFSLSLDDFVVTFFVSGPNTVTFPVKIYSMVRFSVSPEVNAASSLLILLTVTLVTVGLRLQGRELVEGARS